MATVITAVMERLGCQEIQIWGHHMKEGDQVSIPLERNDDPEGGSCIASSLGLVEDRVAQCTEALRRGVLRRCRELGRKPGRVKERRKETHTFKGKVDELNKDFVWGP